ncbi:hypothetical protein Tco_0284021, partial [Tanacetum coccineum]
GFGWDTEKCILTAPDDVWDSYLKLSTVFGKDRASGSQAIDLGDDEVVSEAHQIAPSDLEDEDIDRKLESEIELMKKVQNEIDMC